MLLEELAERLVEVTSSLVGGRTINIMNPEGIIIASTERERVGSFHQGALEAVRTGRVVNIRKDQLSQYPGAKEGCNMPLRVDGTIIGVVGIYGDPESIRDVAHLLEVYAAKYYELEAMLRPRLSESVLRSQLLMRLLSPSNTSLSSAYSLMETLGIRFQFPISVVVISQHQGFSLPENAQEIWARLEQMKLLHPQSDVWGIVEERMVLLCSDGGGNLTQLKIIANQGFRVSIGAPCASPWDIPQAYNQASLLDLSCGDGYHDIWDISTRCSYLLAATASKDEAFLVALAEKLRNHFSPEDCRVLLSSAKAYYDCGRSVTLAAQQQFVHKNTLQYRVKRLQEVLGIEKLPGFWQEYLIRLLLEYEKRNLRPQALK